MLLLIHFILDLLAYSVPLNSSVCDQKLSSTKAHKAQKTDDELAEEQRGGCERSPGAHSSPERHSEKVERNERSCKAATSEAAGER